MALGKCPKCGKEIPIEEDECPSCGYTPMLGNMMRDSEERSAKPEVPEVTEKDSRAERGEETTQSPNSGESREESPSSANESERDKDNFGSDPKASTRKRNVIIAAVSGFGAVIVLVIVLFASHAICFHEWSDATCTEPKTCSVCGRTQGEPTGHEWIDATCTEPKTCSKCGGAEGDALGHGEWKWQTTKKATLEELGEKQRICPACGAVSETKKTYFYDLTDSDVALYASVLDTYNSLKASHMNPDSFELLGAVAKPDGKRTTICVSYVGGGEKLTDYFWKDTYEKEVSNRFGIENYEGKASGTPEVLDLDKIRYFENCGGYEKTDCKVDVG